jgi:hypothetical protein
MIERLKHSISFYSSHIRHARSMRWFVALVYGWFLINALMLWDSKELIWGAESVIQRYGAPNRLLNNIAYALMYDRSKFQIAFALHLLGAFFGMWDKRWAFVPRSIAWFTGVLLFFAAIPAFNSGILIMLLMSFFTIPFYSKSKAWWRIALSNASRSAAIVQLIMLYALSAFFKLSGDQWLQGSAVYYSLNIDRFSSSELHQWIADKYTLLVVLNYASLAYQVLFPAVIFMKRGRNLMLFVGVLFHLSIGWAMHLWDFALAMIFCYPLLWKSDKSE